MNDRPRKTPPRGEQPEGAKRHTHSTASFRMTNEKRPTMARTLTERTPVTADKSLFTFYDIESLSNAFTVVAYLPQPAGTKDIVEVFYLLDDEAIKTQIVPAEINAAIFEGNPGLPDSHIVLHDLGTPLANVRLAELMGLSDADQVCHKSEESSYPADLRPVCDTDDDYDATVHSFLAGYNSQNYDTTMLAQYLYEVFADVVAHRSDVSSAQEAVHQAQAALSRALTPQMQQLATAELRDAQALLHNASMQTPQFTPPTAAAMRRHNDQLFSDENREYMPGYLGWKSQPGKLRRSMMNSGRHLDVARLNELQYKVSLKRLLGMLGYQIKESEQLSHNTVIKSIAEFLELIAYNVADCLGLSQLFRHPTYSSSFDLKASLLAQYTECRFAKTGSVRRDRLAIDTTSAKFVGRILAPYEALSDIESVSFMYPHPEVAKETGVESVNVLSECVRFFEQDVVPDRATNPNQAKAYEDFMKIVNYYRDIEGRNFNESEEYSSAFPNGRAPDVLKFIPKTPNNLPYFHTDGTTSSCFATFSTGGIHGAEADVSTYRQDELEHQLHQGMINLAKMLWPATEFVAEAKRQHNLLTLPDGTTVDKSLVLLGSDPAKVKYRKPKKDDPVQADMVQRAQAQLPDPAALLALQRPAEQALDVAIPEPQSPTGTFVIHGKVVLAKTSASGAVYRDEPSKKAPELFTAKDDGSNKLHPKYTRTSAGLVIHEDFTSYYPNLLRNMRAFYNPELGEDRYAAIFFDKERYGREMKQPGIPEAERNRLDILRNGTKLILNSASGAGDATHKNPIRMNNQIISMRVIGQLFSWRIGQAQTLAGGRIISTNTDGLYSIINELGGFTVEANNRVLEEQSAAIGVDIEPEPLFLISKDSNNRLELAAPAPGTSVADSKILTAGGGTLACFKGPSPTKALAHPAVIDHTLARYLQITAARGEAALAEDFDPVLGAKLINDALDLDNPVETAMFFQNMITASRGSITYPFAAEPIQEQLATRSVDVDRDSHDIGVPGESLKATRKETNTEALQNPRALQMVNRMFVVRSGTPNAVSLHLAAAPKISAVSQARRASDPDLKRVERDNVAIEILRHHGWAEHLWDANNSDLMALPEDRDVTVRRINGIDPLWSVVISNEDLHAMDPERLTALLESLDLSVYVQMLDETFSKNWKNTVA